MPRYYFECYHASRSEPFLSHDLPDAGTAHIMAIKLAGEILKDDAQPLVDGHELSITVSDETQGVLFRFYAASIPVQ